MKAQMKIGLQFLFWKQKDATSLSDAEIFLKYDQKGFCE